MACRVLEYSHRSCEEVGPSVKLPVVKPVLAQSATLTEGVSHEAHTKLTIARLDQFADHDLQSVFRRRVREQRFAQRVTIEDPELHPEVVTAVVALSPQQRACVYLTYWEDLALNDVAERLGIGEGTVKRYLARARARLREVLND